MFKNNNKNTRMTSLLVFLLLTLNIFRTFFYNVSIVDFEQVNLSWVHACWWSILYAFNKIFTNKKRFSVANHLKRHSPLFPFCRALHLFWVGNFKVALHRRCEEWLFFRIFGKLPRKRLGWNPVFVNQQAISLQL